MSAFWMGRRGHSRCQQRQQRSASGGNNTILACADSLRARPPLNHHNHHQHHHINAHNSSTSVGVTVSPVRVASLDAFGSLEAVGARLLETEAKKESTLDVRMVSEAARRGAGGAALYDYEYELNSTRGRKRIVNTVSITGAPSGCAGGPCGGIL